MEMRLDAVARGPATAAGTPALARQGLDGQGLAAHCADDAARQCRP